jgi:hypothetical protein
MKIKNTKNYGVSLVKCHLILAFYLWKIASLNWSTCQAIHPCIYDRQRQHKTCPPTLRCVKFPLSSEYHHVKGPTGTSGSKLEPLINVCRKIMASLTFMGPCIVRIFQHIYPTRCNVTHFICKLLYVFLVVPPPIIRSAYNRIYSISYVTPLLLPAASTTAAGSSNSVINIRCCRYSCMRSWWWVEVPPETCRAVSR